MDRERESERRYWEGVNADYEASVTSVYENDRGRLVLRWIAEAAKARPDGRAADLGCGTGTFLPALAEGFGSVEACDWSETGLAAARERCHEFSNTRFHRFDLAEDPVPFEPVDFALCVNVLIMPDLDRRLRAWRAVTGAVSSTGKLLLVAPSHESAQMEQYQDLEACLDAGLASGEAVERSLPSSARASDLQLGVFEAQGARIKHYLRAELELMLGSFGLAAERVERIEYPADARSGMRASWDWLVEARRD